MNAYKVLTTNNLFHTMQEYLPGRPKMVIELERESGCKNPKELLDVAFEYRHWKAADWLQKYQPDSYILAKWDRTSADYPTPAYRELETAVWLHNHLDTAFPRWTAYFCAAARNGDIQLLQFLLTHRQEKCSRNTMNWAARFGHLHIIKYLHENRTEGCTKAAMDWAAMNGHLHVLKYLHENRDEGCYTSTMDWAARNGHLEVVQFLHMNRSEGCSSNAMNYAAQNGHLEIVKFLHCNRTEGCSKNAIDWAAKNGHIDAIKYLFEHRKEGFTRQAIDWALENGHMNVVHYLDKDLKSRCMITYGGFGVRGMVYV